MISYLLDDTELSERNRIALAQADALVERGHRVRIVTTGLPVTWRPSRAEWVYVDRFSEYDASGDDFVIDAAAISGQIVDDDFYRAVTPREHVPRRVLLCGEQQTEALGVDEGYGAVAHARWFHQKIDLIRASAWAPSREEPLDSVQEFHAALTTAELTRLVHSCDVLIAPSHREDRFGLAAAEALASGIPCVVTSIPTYLSFDGTHDYALFAPEANAVELGERLIELLSDAALRERLRIRGREVAEQWRAQRVVARLEQVLRSKA